MHYTPSEDRATSERQQLGMIQMLRRYLAPYLSLVVQRHLAGDAAIGETLAWKGATLARQRAMRLATADARTADQLRDPCLPP